MAGHGWGRSQKYQDRPRYLYALFFQNGACYIGQSVNLKTRLDQHRLPSGGWMGAIFQMVQLDVVNGTQQQAEEHEFAWRYKAQNAGWIIYGKPPSVVVDATRHMSLKGRLLALRMKWPNEYRRTVRLWPWTAGILAIAVLFLFVR